MELLDVIKIADFAKNSVSEETKNFLFSDFCSYDDKDDDEHLISICSAQDCQMFPTDQVEQEVGELARIAAENDCSYVRFI